MAVYFVQGETTGNIKIGNAANPWARMRDLQMSSSEKLNILHVLHGGRPIEAAFHRRFKEYRIIGEWFRNEGALKDFIQNPDKIKGYRKATKKTYIVSCILPKELHGRLTKFCRTPPRRAFSRIMLHGISMALDDLEKKK